MIHPFVSTSASLHLLSVWPEEVVMQRNPRTYLPNILVSILACSSFYYGSTIFNFFPIYYSCRLLITNSKEIARIQNFQISSVFSVPIRSRSPVFRLRKLEGKSWPRSDCSVPPSPLRVTPLNLTPTHHP